MHRGPPSRHGLPLSTAARPGGGADSAADGEHHNAVAARYASLVAIVERMTGERVQVMDPADLQDRRAAPAEAMPAAAAGWGMEAVVTDTSVEREATAVSIDER